MVAVLRVDADFEFWPKDEIVGGESSYTLIVGLGSTGLAAAHYLAGRNEAVRVIDSRARPPGLEALKASYPALPVELESLDSRSLAGARRVVLSPGLSIGLPLLDEARARGIPIVSEIDLFAEAATAPVIAVTGSNGKSTVTTLTAEILLAQGFNAPRGGNLGPPALELLAVPNPDVYVLEISSFQMEATQNLKPLSCALLNISADHMDRHASVAAYADLKAKLAQAADHTVFNWDDPLVRQIGLSHANATPFSIREPLARGWSIIEHNGKRWLAQDSKPLIASGTLGLSGAIGEANTLAALALSTNLHGDCESAIAAAKSFRGLPHRSQVIAVRRDVTFIDDSKATNVGAAATAIAAARGPVVLIAGGRGKAQDFAPLAKAASGRVRAAILLGEAVEELENAFAGTAATSRATNMRDAVAAAIALADPGDTVLLAPACASQDMFVDYHERGEAFKRAVEELA